jgi:hypothetical protein
MEPGSAEETRKHELEPSEDEDVATKRARPAAPEVNGNSNASQDDAAAGAAQGGWGAAAPAEESAPAPSADAEAAAPSADADAAAPSAEADAYPAWNHQLEERSSMGATEAPPAPVMAPPPGFEAGGGYSGAGYGGPGYGGPGLGGGGGGGFGGGAQVCRDFQNGLCHRGARCGVSPA